jgi:hypothetical protein
LSQLLALGTGPWLVCVTFLGITTRVAIYYHSRAAQMHFGLTSEFSGLVTSLCDVLVEVAAVTPALLPTIIRPIGAVAALAACGFYWLRRGDAAAATQDVKLTPSSSARP